MIKRYLPLVGFILVFSVLSGSFLSVLPLNNENLPISPVWIASGALPDEIGLASIRMVVQESAPAGTYLRIIDTIRNQAESYVDDQIISYWLISDSTHDEEFEIGAISLDGLIPGGQKTINITVPVPPDIKPGTYWVMGNILPAGSEPGISGSIHSSESPVTILPYGQYFIGIEDTSINEFIRGDEGPVTLTAINTNTTIPLSTKIHIYLSKTGNIEDEYVIIAESEDMFLTPGEERRISIFPNIPDTLSDGKYYLIYSFLPLDLVTSHSSGALWVSSQQVTISSVSEPVIIPSIIPTIVPDIPVSPEPDLLSVRTDYPDTLFIGDSYTITDSVQNIGGSAAGIVRVEYKLSPNPDGSDGRYVGRWSVQNVKPNEIRSSKVILSAPDRFRPGIYYLTKEIIVISSPPEKNTGNNYWTGNRPIIAQYSPSALIPDLTHVKTIFPCANPGDSVEITDTITNIGNACAQDVSVAYYISPYMQFDPASAHYLGVWKISKICVGEQQTNTITVTVPSSLRNGEYYWFSVIDPCSFMGYCLDEIPEFDKSNNINIGRLTIGPCVFCRC